MKKLVLLLLSVVFALGIACCRLPMPDMGDSSPAGSPSTAQPTE